MLVPLKAYRNKKTNCLEWLGSLNEDGYGIIHDNKKHFLVHRLAYALCNGPIYRQLLVLHKCDNPKCFEPSHLFLGTQLENIADMVKKKRNKPPTGMAGEKNPMAILTEEMVRSIRRDCPRGMGRVYARKFGVSRQTISAVLNNKIWKDVL